MASSVKIRSDYPASTEKQLIEEVCQRRRCKRAFVKPFARFGFSGARLHLIYFNDRPIGVPYLLKVSKLGKVKGELRGARILRSDVEDANNVDDYVFSATDGSGQRWGALLYRYYGKKSEGTEITLALRKRVFDSSFPPSELRATLGQVFEKLKDAHSKQAPSRVVIKKHFERYFRDYAAEARIRCVLGADADSKKVDFLGAQIYNPLNCLAELPKYANVHVGQVHGDLHPDNVMIDQDGIAHLIDFAWAHDGRDVLVDFVLMETSIRFMAFPRPINLADQLLVDRTLIQEDGPKRIPHIRFCAPSRREDYTRLACVVAAIRDRARTVLGRGFSMQTYLLTQFILLFGLLRYEEYEPYAGTRALGMIAARLKKIGLPA